jgi:hypothetical protein
LAIEDDDREIAGTCNRRVDANREQAETLRQAIRAYAENDEALETRNPPIKAGRCPGKAGEYRRSGQPRYSPKISSDASPILGHWQSFA